MSQISISSIRLQCTILLTLIFSAFTSAHLVLTYPGWRGDNLATNGTVAATNGLSSQNNMHPYGMQWEYPCGGMPTTTNRTRWPVGGGAVAFQPGWFSGHLLSTLYINLGNGTIPTNMSLPMVNAIAINGPSNDAYPGMEVCFPQVPLPAGFRPQIGDNATIQVIMLAQHGAALYSCVDITFADPKNVEEVTPTNCYNSSGITFQQIYQAAVQNAATGSSSSIPSYFLTWMPLALAAIIAVAL